MQISKLAPGHLTKTAACAGEASACAAIDTRPWQRLTAAAILAAASAALADDVILPQLPPGARLAFQEDWSSSQIDKSKWYLLRKKWGQGNNGVTPDNVGIHRDTVNGREQNVLVCQAHGDAYQGPVTGAKGEKSRVGGVIVTKQFFASGRFEVVMKVGAPAGGAASTPPKGAVPAIWTYAYRWVETLAEKQAAFNPEVPSYNPHFKVKDSPAIEYWSEIDFPELGKNGDFEHGLFNVFCQRRYEWKTFKVPPVTDSKYHTYVMEWRTGLKPLPEVNDSQVVEHNGFWWVQDEKISINAYLANPLKRLGKDQYSVCCGLTAKHWVDGKFIGENTRNVPCMAAQLTMGVWLPAWGGPASWQTAPVSFGPVKIWQYDDPGDVRGVLTEDVPPNF